jgi:Mrp family chromosome partitioning ATPase
VHDSRKDVPMRERPAPILVVTGPSGVGKSTVSRLVAATLDKSVHVRMDDFLRFVVSGWVDPWLPEAAHQNEVLGGAVVAAAMQFSAGGYTAVVDGDVFPDAAEELAGACRRRGVPFHYAVLRCDLDTCVERATTRAAGERPDPGPFAALHARFTDLGEHESNVVEATAAPDDVAAAVLRALRSGRLARP